jgi:hypothetical protein
MRPDSHEAELIERAVVAADRIERLEKTLAKAGETFIDKDGVYRPSPLLAEIRQQNVILLRALNGISMEPDKGKDPVAQRAGRASWAARSRDMARG